MFENTHILESNNPMDMKLLQVWAGKKLSFLKQHVTMRVSERGTSSGFVGTKNVNTFEC